MHGPTSHRISFSTHHLFHKAPLLKEIFAIILKNYITVLIYINFCPLMPGSVRSVTRTAFLKYISALSLFSISSYTTRLLCSQRHPALWGKLRTLVIEKRREMFDIYLLNSKIGLLICIKIIVLKDRLSSESKLFK